MGKAYPACDDPAARGALAALYNNNRLTHAAGISSLHNVGDGAQGRRCSASVTWSDGSRSEVAYMFSYSNKSRDRVSMWIDFNGGMRGPSY